MDQGGTHIGIDPGLTGGIAITKGDTISLYEMPTIAGQLDAGLLSQLIISYGPYKTATIERVHSMPGQGVKSMFTFGLVYGQVIQELERRIHEPDLIFVEPRAWKHHFDLLKHPRQRKVDKDATRKYCLERWPRLADQLARKKDHGKADALLITTYTQETRL